MSPTPTLRDLMRIADRCAHAEDLDDCRAAAKDLLEVAIHLEAVATARAMALEVRDHVQAEREKRRDGFYRELHTNLTVLKGGAQ